LIYVAWLIWLIPLASIPLIPLLALISNRIRDFFAVSVSGVSAILGLYLALNFYKEMGENLTLWIPIINLGLEVKLDGLSVILSAFISSLSFIIMVYSIGYMGKEKGLTRYYSLMLLFIGSMLGLVLAGNLIQLYFFWELVGICSALLIAFWNERVEARKAGFKAFLITRIGDASLLIALLLMLSTFNSVSYDRIFSLIKDFDNGLLSLIAILILIGCIGKSAQFPLHIWLPDAMEGPTPVSALIHAATMVNAGVYLLARMFPLFELTINVLLIVVVIGSISMILGASLAITSKDLKRILAYSTISNLGLMFLSIGIGNWLLSIYHLISHGIFKALGFLSAGSVIHSLKSRDIDEMGGLKDFMKLTYIGFLISVLAMSGLPPLVGFWTKELILSYAIKSNIYAGISIAFASILTSIYSFRALLRVFHGKPKVEKLKESSLIMLIPILILAISSIFAWYLLSSQNILVLSSKLEFEATSISLSAFGLTFGIIIAYITNLRNRIEFLSFVQSNSSLLKLREIMVSGLGIDSLYYSFYKRAILPITRFIIRLQTGLLGINLLFMLSILIILLSILSLRLL